MRELPALNSFFSDFDRREEQTRALLEWLKSREGSAPLVLVTHQVNITALTGIYPDSGELVIVRVNEEGQLVPAGRIKTR